MSYLDKTIAQQMTPDEIRDRARAWYDRQIDVLAKAHGPAWPAHRAWIEQYLKQEIRDRLYALGWRPKP